MSVQITNSYSMQVPKGEPLATVEKGWLYLWPAGIGKGAVISMPVSEWHTLSHSADEAVRVAGMRPDYTACEGADHDES